VGRAPQAKARAGIIQAWGDLNDPSQAGRMIIDCNLNLPLLYWASEATGNTDETKLRLRGRILIA